jgi:1-acyl-sn-glycerol-3-phosphate acyltransferase
LDGIIIFNKGKVVENLRGIFNFTILFINIIFWVPLLLCFALFKWILPLKLARKIIDLILVQISQCWISCNGLWITKTQKINWDVQGLSSHLDLKKWYMVISNHQSWVDIFVLQFLFNRKIPLLKFFLKKELIYVPFMGLAWWALDFPFMRRYSKSYLKKYPEKKGQDFELTKIACEKFKLIPTSVMNFIEGTRFNLAKHQKQNSPYQYLLRPKIIHLL